MFSIKFYFNNTCFIIYIIGLLCVTQIYNPHFNMRKTYIVVYYIIITRVERCSYDS